MALKKEQKQQMVSDLKDRLERQKATVFVDYKGLSVKALSSLRSDLRKEGMDMKVAKKTLIDLAIKESGIDDVSTRALEGQVGAVFGYEDESGPAKILKKFKKTNQSLELLGGLLMNDFIDKAGVLSLANMPTKQELLAQFVGTINAPVSGFVRVLGGNLTGLVTVLSKINK